MSKKSVSSFGQLSLMADLCQIELDSNIITCEDARFSKFLTEWKQARYFTLDIETQGNNDYSEGLDHYRGSIRLIQIKLYQKPEILVIDFQKVVPVSFLEILKETLWNDKQHCIGHNIQFDLTWIRQQLGFKTRNPYCTRILSILVNCGIKWVGKQRMAHGLKDICKRLEIGDVDKSEQTSDWSQPKLSNSQINYAAKDVVYTEQAFIKMSHQLLSYDKMPSIDGMPCRYTMLEVLQIECFAIPSFVEIILKGQPIDLEYALEVKQQYLDAIQDIYKPAEELLQLPFSASSDKLCLAIWDKLDIWLLADKSFKELAAMDSEGDEDDNVVIKQDRLFGKPLPDVPRTKKLSTSSANLFNYYSQTNNDLLLRVSLVRSLKKCVDSLDALISSAKQNNGYAKGRYTSLGSTGSGRSTCSGDKKSSLHCTNLQNIAGSVEHPIVDAYNLPPVRSVIRNNSEKGMWLCDLSASHIRLAAFNSGDNTLVDILAYKDPHSLITSKMLKLSGVDRTREYCEKNKKTDAQVAYYRQIGKVATYTSFNDGSPQTFLASLNKSFVNVDLKDCELAHAALGETFPGYQAYAEKLKHYAQGQIVKIGVANFVRYRTHDGRLFHIQCNDRVNRWTGERYDHFKLGEITSRQLISPEALLMKKAMKEITEFIWENEHLPIALNTMTHDDFSGEDKTEDKVLAKFVYKTVLKHFSEALPGLDCGIKDDPEGYKSILINNYSEK